MKLVRFMMLTMLFLFFLAGILNLLLSDFLHFGIAMFGVAVSAAYVILDKREEKW